MTSKSTTPDWAPWCGAESITDPLRVCVLDPADHLQCDAKPHEDEDGSTFYMTRKIHAAPPAEPQMRTS